MVTILEIIGLLLIMFVPGLNVVIGVIFIVIFIVGVIFTSFKNNNESTPSSSTDNKVTELTNPSLETNFKTNSNKEQVYNNIEVSVAGVTYYNRQEIIKKLNKNSIIELRREYNNQFDKNAIAVYANSNQIGYIPKEIAVNLAKRIDGGEKLIASILAIVGGGSYNYGVKLLLKTVKKSESYNENVTNSFKKENFSKVNDLIFVEKGIASKSGIDMPESFCIQKYLVTQAEFQALMGYNPSDVGGKPSNPVEQVTWYDAVMYANKLSEAEGLLPYYNITAEVYAQNPRRITSAIVKKNVTTQASH